MAVVFDGRFHAPYSNNLEDYFKAEYSLNGATLSDEPPLAAGRPGYYEYASDPAGVEDRVVRVYANNPDRPGRAELRPFERMFGNTGGPVYGTNWIAFWTYFPRGPFDLYEGSGGFTTDVPEVASTNHIFWQIPAWVDADDIVPPGVNGHHSTFILAVVNNNIEFRRTSDANTPTLVRAPNQVIIRRFCPLEWVFDRWVEWVFHVKHAYDGTGFIHIYMDRYLLLSLTSINSAYNDALGPYLKGGLYKFFNTTYSPEEIITYTKGFVLGDASSSYAEVTGHASLGRRAGRGVM